ncbi:hypothetical protein [Cryptosporangium sp. NPDC051539]|uniref:hypothetical protein n=1 Tax=Cryptosporangium sp. NPDC051539 TaxID=3363962 RepID=UPI0037A2905A
MPSSEEDLLIGADWDIPLTDSLVEGVQRGVRRRKAYRVVVTGGAALFVVALALVFVLDRAYTGDVTSRVSMAPAVSPVVDGFSVGHVPDGARFDGPVSSYACGFTATGTDCQGQADPSATVTFRQLDRRGSRWISVAVCRPLPADPAAERAEITRRLVAWQVGSAVPVETVDVTVGRARILEEVGSQVTAYHVVIEADDGVVIAIEADAAVGVDELRTVAQSITPTR